MEPLFNTGNDTVDQMGRLQITGNVIPAAWYRTIRRETGKPYLAAIVILADIVYWYRPVEIREEGSGQLVGFRKKFKSDLLQRSYQQMADQFGISKRDAANAVIELEKLGVIRRVFRSLEMNGQTIPNVLFLDLNVEVLRHLTFPEEMEYIEKQFPSKAKRRETGETGRGCPRFQGDISLKRERGIPDFRTTSSKNRGEDISEMGETNTENTYKEPNGEYPITSYQVIREQFEEQIAYGALIRDGIDRECLDELVEIAVDILTSRKQTLRINSEEIEAERVKERYQKLNMLHIKYVLGSLQKTRTRARNIRAVMATALYNAGNTMSIYYDNLYRSNRQRTEGGKETDENGC